MTPCECQYEAEVLEAVVQGRWPERVDAELRAHGEGCAICSDVVAIAGAIDDGRAAMAAGVAIPDSGRVWWLAQRRARLEAAEAAARPVMAVQGVALISACIVLVAYFRGAMGRFEIGAWLASATSVLIEHGVLALAIAGVVFLLPAAVYLVIARE